MSFADELAKERQRLERRRAAEAWAFPEEDEKSAALYDRVWRGACVAVPDRTLPKKETR